MQPCPGVKVLIGLKVLISGWLVTLCRNLGRDATFPFTNSPYSHMLNDPFSSLDENCTRSLSAAYSER